jgi:hypothetical protein
MPSRMSLFTKSPEPLHYITFRPVPKMARGDGGGAKVGNDASEIGSSRGLAFDNSPEMPYRETLSNLLGKNLRRP